MYMSFGMVLLQIIFDKDSRQISSAKKQYVPKWGEKLKVWKYCSFLHQICKKPLKCLSTQ